MRTYTLHLLRHGLTIGNIKGQYIGVTDLPLTTDGINELKYQKGSFSYPKVKNFFSSPLKRCRDTLDILYDTGNIELVEEIKERDFGLFEGKTLEELQKDPAYLTWMEDGGSSAPPKGESMEQFMKRVLPAFNRIVVSLMKSGEFEAVVCTHGLVIMTVLAAYGLPRREYYEWMTTNGRGYTLRITPSVWMREGMFEVVDTIPVGDDRDIEDPQQRLVDASKFILKEMEHGQE